MLAGLITIEPVDATLPIPLSIVTESALAEFQLKVAFVPALMVVGSIIRLTVGAGNIFTVTDAVVVPPAPVAVAV